MFKVICSKCGSSNVKVEVVHTVYDEYDESYNVETECRDCGEKGYIEIENW